MKKDNIDKLIDILSSSNCALTAKQLSSICNVDARTIRNYVNEVNKSGNYRINASKNGYEIETCKDEKHSINADEIIERTNTILYSLLTQEDGINVFDLANSLAVSESTVTNDISSRLKTLLESYNLDIRTKDFTLSIVGQEKDKRRLIGYIATHNATNYFSSKETLQKLYPEVNIDDISRNLRSIIDNSGMTMNNFALNNLLIHLIIIILRLKTNNELSEEMVNDTHLSDVNQNSCVLQTAESIKNYCYKLTGVFPSDSDYLQILLLLSINHDTFQNEKFDFEVFDKHIDSELFNFNIKLLLNVQEHFCLPEMDDQFMYQFTLHVDTLLKRSKYNISYPNPLADQIKKEYAPVYDIAVYYTAQLSRKYSIIVSEDEIGFIAFHFGAYLENCRNKEYIVNTLVISDNYHDSAKTLVHELHLAFNNDMHLLDVVTYDQFTRSNYNPDLIITTQHIISDHPYCVYINPLSIKKKISLVYSIVEDIKTNKRFSETISIMKLMFSKSLYFNDLDCSSAEDCIVKLASACRTEGYIESQFVNDVLSREMISSTAFTDNLAVPHSISQYSNRSFIAVVHNKKKIPWGNKSVNFVLLVGVAEGDMKYFSDVIGIIIESFSSVAKTAQLLQTETFEEFMQSITTK